MTFDLSATQIFPWGHFGSPNLNKNMTTVDKF